MEHWYTPPPRRFRAPNMGTMAGQSADPWTADRQPHGGAHPRSALGRLATCMCPAHDSTHFLSLGLPGAIPGALSTSVSLHATPSARPCLAHSVAGSLDPAVRCRRRGRGALPTRPAASAGARPATRSTGDARLQGGVGRQRPVGQRLRRRRCLVCPRCLSQPPTPRAWAPFQISPLFRVPPLLTPPASPSLLPDSPTSPFPPSSPKSRAETWRGYGTAIGAAQISTEELEVYRDGLLGLTYGEFQASEHFVPVCMQHVNVRCEQLRARVHVLWLQVLRRVHEDMKTVCFVPLCRSIRLEQSYRYRGTRYGNIDTNNKTNILK